MASDDDGAGGEVKRPLGARRTAYVNGTYVPLDRAQVSVLDRGFLFGDGVYEVAPVLDGRLFTMDRTLQRLERSMTEIGLTAAHPVEARWARSIMEVGAPQRAGGRPRLPPGHARRRPSAISAFHPRAPSPRS